MVAQIDLVHSAGVEPNNDQRVRRTSRRATRAGELGRIEELSRRAAAARSPRELFDTLVTGLYEQDEIEAALVGSALDGPFELIAYLGRPLGREHLAALARRAAAALDAEPTEPRIVELDELEADADWAPAEEVTPAPIEHAGQRVAVLVFVPTRRRDQGRRLLYAAANQAALHLARLRVARADEEHRLGSVLDSMPQAVIVLDERLRALRSNGAARELLGPLGLALDGDWAAQLDRLGLGREAVHGSSELELPGERALSATISPWADAEGSRGLVLVLVDRTESRRLERRLAQSEKMSSLGQLISGTAHELNNPLTSVLGYAQLLAASELAAGDPEIGRRLSVLRRDAERCQRIVQNLLAFARRRPPERKPVSINQVLESTIALVAYALRVEGVSVTTELDPTVPAIEGDAHELQQAVLNLLTNAKDALAGRDEPGTIVVRSRVSGAEVLVDVEDNGPGIPPEIVSRVFDPFFTTKPEGRGTGLGLALVYGAVTSHGGTVEVLPPRDARGATLRIRLPASGAGSARRAEPRENVTNTTRARVLVVDDEPTVARMVADVLEADGHRVECVTDGTAALERMRGESFDAIVADLRMPGLDGARLVESIRRERPDLMPRVVLATGDTLSDEAERTAAEAGLELLEKPFDLERLRASVRRRASAARR
jgi:signal transduction histidine kinase/ActR/RegA family two-component response regulator